MMLQPSQNYLDFSLYAILFTCHLVITLEVEIKNTNRRKCVDLIPEINVNNIRDYSQLLD